MADNPTFIKLAVQVLEETNLRIYETFSEGRTYQFPKNIGNLQILLLDLEAHVFCQYTEINQTFYLERSKASFFRKLVYSPNTYQENLSMHFAQ